MREGRTSLRREVCTRRHIIRITYLKKHGCKARNMRAVRSKLPGLERLTTKTSDPIEPPKIPGRGRTMKPRPESQFWDLLERELEMEVDDDGLYSIWEELGALREAELLQLRKTLRFYTKELPPEERLHYFPLAIKIQNNIAALEDTRTYERRRKRRHRQLKAAEGR